jgi:hypothetical protein
MSRYRKGLARANFKVETVRSGSIDSIKKPLFFVDVSLKKLLGSLCL